ncbi:MAG: AMP-binding protein, partial [Actinobacteria bacterium]|nr:AMP-binding protein [Actinomycetota bacterium]
MMAGIAHWAAATPDAAAIVTLARQITFDDLNERQKRIAGFARAGGLGTGDRVAVLSGNRPESLEATVGLLRAGIVPVPINPLLTEPEIAYVLEDSQASLLFTDRRLEHPVLDRVVTFGDAYERVLDEAEPAELGDFARGRPMHYTSGTTGRSKGVWVDPVDDRDAARLSTAFRSLWGLDADEVHLVCSPLAHSAPHRFAMRTLEAGGTVVLQSKFDAHSMLAGIELVGVTSTFVVPTHLERILALEPKILRAHDLSSMRTLAHAGAPIRNGTKRKTIELFPDGSVWEFYGSTEGQATRISTAEWLRKPGSVGTPVPGAEILVLDDRGNEVERGEVGQIWIRDPGAETFSYWGDEAKTRAAWKGDAFTVGDLGYLDEDGYLFLTGRKHDTIITGGVNVYPQEVETVLLEHPAVAEVVVFGVPHDEWGQEVRAHVVAAPNMPLDGERLREWARDRLAGFKCPRYIEVVAELERTATGKIKRP